jgi:hypothetical protein
MPRRELVADFRSALLGCWLRRARNRLAVGTDSARGTSAAVPPGSSGPDGNDRAGARRARLLRKAAVHGQVVIRISALMQGNIGERDDIRQRLAGLHPMVITPDDGSVTSQASTRASLQQEIEVLNRIIGWQLRTIDWHTEEDRRLRAQATRIGGPQAPPVTAPQAETIQARHR